MRAAPGHAALGRQFVGALKEMDQRLRIYPQFGEPLSDLHRKATRIWIAVAPPLVMRYVLDDDKRLVMVVTPPMLLPEVGN